MRRLTVGLLWAAFFGTGFAKETAPGAGFAAIVGQNQEGNFYIAEVDNGGVQKFTPRPGANPDYLVGKPLYAAWE